MNRKGLLIVISGPSGTGKGTICKELLSRNIPDLELSISVTTRKPRTGELDGLNYFFKDKAKFIEMIENNEFIEYARVYDNYYGTPKQYVFDRLNEGKDVILEIDTQGAVHVKNIFDEGILIFIVPPSFAELKNRILNRGTETEEDIKKRLKCANEELKLSSYYDYLIVNDNIIKAADKVESILQAEKCKIKRINIDYLNFEEE